MLRPPREDVRQRLVTVAIASFERDGYGGASLAAIAEEAGFSRGAVYSNFASKEDLFLAALERNARERVDALFNAQAGLRSGKVDAASISSALALTRTWSLLFMEFCLQARRANGMQERLQATRRRMRDDVVAHLAKASAESSGAGRTPEELALIAALLMAINNGIMLEMVCDPELDIASLSGMVAAVFTKLSV